MKKRVCVIGMGRFGIGVASELYQAGHDVLVIDNDDDRVQSMTGQATYAVRSDATNETGLRQLGVHEYDVAVLTLGDENVQSSILIAMVLKSMGIGHIIARAANQLHGETLERIGVNRVVFPEEESAKRLAHVDFNPGRPGLHGGCQQRRHQQSAPPARPCRWSGRPSKTAGLAGKTVATMPPVSVLAVRRGRGHILTPSKDEVIQPGDVLVVVGPSEYVASVFTTAPPASGQQETEAVPNPH